METRANETPGMLMVYSLNVNGFKNRPGNKLAFFSLVKASRPDVVCLQETGRSQSIFPLYSRIEGYHTESAFDAEGVGTTGVSIMSRIIPDSITRTICEDGLEHRECRGRFISAKWSNLSVASIYAPNPDAPVGKANQVRFFECLRSHMLKNGQTAYIVAGDFNTILGDSDTYDRVKTRSSPWANRKSRSILSQTIESGWVDTFRRIHGQALRRVTAWHSKAAFESAGFGVDFQLASPPLGDSLVRADILRPETYETQYSDHAATTAQYDI